VHISEFDFELPAELVAQEPPSERGGSRLLVLSRTDGGIEHDTFAHLARYVRRGDLLVVNDTRVFPARLLGHRVPSGGAVECLLLERVASVRDGLPSFLALVHPGQKLKTGARIVFERGGRRLHGEIAGRHFHGRRTVLLWTEDGSDVDEAVDRVGHVPLPPYIKREDAPDDRERYQTVYALERGSVAAPTAGLHFSNSLLDALAANGVERTAVTLHVGYGTFKPVRVEQIEEHQVDPEPFIVSEAAADALTRARREGRRIIAVGTTTARTLESLALESDGRVLPARASTGLFIRPGHQFRLVGGLLTNFHLPKSSLLMLVSAFAGREHVMAAYREAVQRKYRFYSYGDAMLIV
jgi:S-adenosylmethionine:tRNA ribosyltransferase-isomerase